MTINSYFSNGSFAMNKPDTEIKRWGIVVIQSLNPNDYKTGEILYIPKTKIEEYDTDEPANNRYNSIPCLYIKSNNNSPNNKIYAIFFHGNAEDINLANEKG